MFVMLLIFLSSSVESQTRTEVCLPEIEGYNTLRCDFHEHTVYSDGLVWPTVRVDEAWYDGLDAIAITDHAEYHPHKDVDSNLNKPYEIALPRAKALGIILIKGAEITREMPPGHLNALFLTDANAVKKKDYKDALKAAKEHGAFIQWNHPPFPQPEGKCILYPEHKELIEMRLINGIEIVNGKRAYYPEAFKWCREYNLTITGNSDVHNPIYIDYYKSNIKHRPVTLVFAKERTEEGIKEAMFAGRTAVYYIDTIYGEEKYLRGIFERIVTIKSDKINLGKSKRGNIQLHNDSEIDIELEANGNDEAIVFPKKVVIPSDKTVLVPVTVREGSKSIDKDINLAYKVKNMRISADEWLDARLKVRIVYKP